MSRHGENIYKRCDGRYEGRYIIGRKPDGKAKFGYIFGYKYADVRQQLLECKRRVCAASQDQSTVRHGTLGAWMTYWLENELRPAVKQSSYQTYHSSLHRHILPSLGRYEITQVTPNQVQAFFERMLSDGLAASTAKGVYRFLRTGLMAAMEAGLIQSNPCRRLRLRTQKAVEQRVLTPQEETKVRSCLTPKELPALVGLQTGMRLGEICALQWRDVIWDTNTIVVRRTVQRLSTQEGGRTALVVGTPKSACSYRAIPISAALAETLRAMRGHEDAFVFGTNDKPADPRTVQRQLQRLLTSCGIRDAHFHTLRHTFATRLLSLGVDVKTVSMLLGHASVKTTLDVYAHSLMEERRDAIERLESAAKRNYEPS